MADALHVLLVSPDRSLLRQGALMLEEFGVEVDACADAARGRQVLAAQQVDFLLLDEAVLDGDEQQIAQWKATCGEAHVHLLLLCSEATTLDIHEAFQCGADDFLRKPFGAGELLARLRAATRYGEFERRFQEQSWEDPVTGLWAKQALVEKLNGELQSSPRGRKMSLAVLELDFFQRWERRHGEERATSLLCQAAAIFAAHALPGQVVARLDGGRFALLLPDQSLEKATKHAERLRAAVAELDAGEVRFTASVGVAPCLGTSDAADDALGRALQALRDAQRSGRDCVVGFGQHDDERRRWAQQMSSGNPFASCAARDVMTPFALELSSTDALAYAETLFAQTQLDVLPVLDGQGRFAGVLERASLSAALSSSTRAAQPIEPLLSREVPKLAETTSLEQVIEHFVAQDQPLLVIVSEDGRARGFIERERFLDLVNPIAPIAPATSYSSRTEYLVVPDWAGSM